MLVCVFFFANLHARPRVQRAPGLPCALCFSRARNSQQNSGASRRENADLHSVVIARLVRNCALERAIQYSRGSSDGIEEPQRTGYPAFEGYDSGYPACFPPLLAPNKGREIGGGRATRQPGQVRKEAALTRSGSGRSSVSYLFFRANRAKSGGLPRSALAPLRRYSAKVGTGFAT